MRPQFKTQYGVTRSVGGRVSVVLAITCLATATMSFGGLAYATMRLDQIARQASEHTVERLIEDWQQSLTRSVEDYAHWTLAFEVITERDKEAIYDNIGSGAVEGELFDAIVIASPSGAVLDLFGALSDEDAGQLLGAGQPDGALQELFETDPSDYSVTLGVRWVGDQVVIWSSAWVTPDDFEEVPAGSFPLLVGVKVLGPEAIASLERAALASPISVSETLPDTHLARVALAKPAGTVGYLVWPPVEPGSAMWSELVPWFIFAQGLIGGMLLLIWSVFRKQARLLDDALEVASTDDLTGIPNRAGLGLLLEAPGIEQARVSGRLAVLTVDLDDFKQVNDTLGHSAGDEVLKVSARRLKSALRNSDHVIRVGGDEFICLIVDPDPAAAAEAAIERIRDLFDEPQSFDRTTSTVGASVGVAIADRTKDWFEILKESDADMYRVKNRRSDRLAGRMKSLGSSLEAPMPSMMQSG